MVYTFLTSFVRRVIYESSGAAAFRSPSNSGSHDTTDHSAGSFYLNLTGQSLLLGLDSLLPAEHGDGKRLISWMQKPTDTKDHSTDGPRTPGS